MKPIISCLAVDSDRIHLREFGAEGPQYEGFSEAFTTLCGSIWVQDDRTPTEASGCVVCRTTLEKMIEAIDGVSDPVKSPDHYTAGEIECIDAIRSALGREGFRAFCQGNVIKYAWRAQHKGREEDFKKAVWYSRMAIGDDPREPTSPTLQPVTLEFT